MIIYIQEKKGQTRFVNTVRLSSIFRMRTNRAKVDRMMSCMDKQSEQETAAGGYEGEIFLTLPEEKYGQ